MKHFTATALIYLLLLSCSNDSPTYTASVMFTDLETADSLYKHGKISDAKLIWEKILKEEPYFNRSAFDLFINTLLFSSTPYGASSFEFEKCNGYIYSCLAQYDALESLYANEECDEKRIEILKRVFTLAPMIDEVSEYLLQLESEERKQKKNHFFRPATSINRYNEYVAKVNPRKKASGITFYSSAEQTLEHLYNRKWSIMNSLLIDMDNKYGYDITFNYFDSILAHHGTSIEEYTKTLFKAYMSFSGKPEYQYDSGIDYNTFKSISKSNESWLVTKIVNGPVLLNRKRLLNKENSGFVVKFDNKYIYNPTIITIGALTGYNQELITINENKVSEIKLLKGVSYALLKNIYMEIDKPLLCAMLLKHGKKDIVNMLASSRQQQTKDGFIRKGIENGYMKTIHYDSTLRIISQK